MAVRLRLMRMGKKKQPTYRVVAADSRKARNGRFIEIVGTYNPRQEPSLVEIDNERALHWLRHGAQPSERVQKLLVISGAWSEFTGEPRPSTVPPAKVTQAASVEAESEAEPAEAAEDSEADDTVSEAESEAEPAEAAEDSEADDTVSEAESAEPAEDSEAGSAEGEEQATEKAEDGGS